jgi:hypothetical protein
MRLTFDPFRLLLSSIAICLNPCNSDVTDYLEEERSFHCEPDLIVAPHF